MKKEDKSKAFRQWQQRMGFSRSHVCMALDIAINTVTGYRNGHRSEGVVQVPKHILLACAAIEAGLEPVTSRKE